jgi:MFS family permease
MATDAPARPSQGLAAYRRVLATPRVRPLVAFALLARMPIGMGAVAIILFIHGQTDSFGIAGGVAGAYTIGLGITGPSLARFIDRHGSRFVIVPGALLVMAAMVALVVLGKAGAGTAPLVAAGFAAGAGSTPIGGIFRQRWPELVAPAELPTAYALDAVMIEVVFVSGPLLAGVLAATVGSAEGLIAAVSSASSVRSASPASRRSSPAAIPAPSATGSAPSSPRTCACSSSPTCRWPAPSARST